MTSEAFVWAYLPGDVDPTVCGLYKQIETAVGPAGTFLYGASYLKNPDAIPLDLIALPLKPIQFSTTTSHGVFGALLDAIPDDWGRYVIDRIHSQQKYPVGYMLHTSDDSIGNLAFSPSSTQIPPQNEHIGSEMIPMARDILLDIDSGKEVPRELVGKVRANTAMGGARPKLTVNDGQRLCLAKFPSHNDDPLLPIAKLEAAMLKLAKICGIESANARVIHDDVLLVERFDRGPLDATGKSRRDAFLSARTLFESNGNQRYVYTGSYSRLAKELVRYCTQGRKDQTELFRRMVFNAYISNTDDHERNHGLIADDMPGTFKLSPAYDLVPRIHRTTRRHHAMILGGTQTLATKENILADCEAFGLEIQDAQEILETIASKVACNWRECLKEQNIVSTGITKLEPCFTEIPTA